MCHHHRAAVVSGDSVRQELGILGGGQMVTPSGLFSETEKESLPA